MKIKPSPRHLLVLVLALCGCLQAGAVLLQQGVPQEHDLAARLEKLPISALGVIEGFPEPVNVALFGGVLVLCAIPLRRRNRG
jgi:hypothetical protein